MARLGGGRPLRGAQQGFSVGKTVEAIIVVGLIKNLKILNLSFYFNILTRFINYFRNLH